MQPHLEEKLWSAGSGQRYDKATWESIIHGLMDDFRDFLAEDFDRDPAFFIEPENSRFGAWMWSKPDAASPLALVWSAVIGGSICASPGGGDEFGASISLFLFHGRSGMRVFAEDGSHYMEFVFDLTTKEIGCWRFVGWQPDEWGEWQDLPFPFE